MQERTPRKVGFGVFQNSESFHPHQIPHQFCAGKKAKLSRIMHMGSEGQAKLEIVHSFQVKASLLHFRSSHSHTSSILSNRKTHHTLRHRVLGQRERLQERCPVALPVFKHSWPCSREALGLTFLCLRNLGTCAPAHKDTSHRNKEETLASIGFGYIWWCSGLIPDSALRNYFC